MQIYVSKDGQLFGPYSEENYKKYLDSSVFSDEHLICVDGTNWVPPFEVFSAQKNKLFLFVLRPFHVKYIGENGGI